MVTVMQKDKKCCTTNASTVLLVSFFLLLVITPTLISARYLPTRSDNSRRERIKEVLRLLLELSNDNDLRLDNLNYGGANAFPLSFSRDASGPSGPLVYEFGDGTKASPASSSSGLSKRSISPKMASDLS